MKKIVPIEISARHLHISQSDFQKIFSQAELTKYQDVSQPGQFAATEQVVLIGPKNKIERVRILGPFREQTQVELSQTDCFTLGITAPVRESGDLSGSGSIQIQGPAGMMDLREGAIVAQRHLHIPTDLATEWGLVNGQIVKIAVSDGPGGQIKDLVFDEVIVRISDQFKLACHIDTDEGNAALIRSEQEAQLIIKEDNN